MRFTSIYVKRLRMVRRPAVLTLFPWPVPYTAGTSQKWAALCMTANGVIAFAGQNFSAGKIKQRKKVLGRYPALHPDSCAHIQPALCGAAQLSAGSGASLPTIPAAAANGES